jgi:MoxR-like ATPase
MSTSSTVDLRKRAHGRTSLERILWMSWFVHGSNGRRGLPYCLVGKPGTAKTSIAGQLASMAGLYFKGVVASLRDPTDFLGLGVPTNIKLDASNQCLSPDGDETFMMMKYAPANFAVDVAVRGRAVLMLDEVNTAPPAVQAALLRLLFEGVCGELELPPGVRMILAMNSTEDAAGGWDIAPPLANRIGWLQWPTPDPKQFAEFLMGSGASKAQPINPAQEEAEVDALWNNAWARAAGEVAGFINAKSDQLHVMPKTGSKAASENWPSPRTWELAARAKAGGYVYNLSRIEIDEAVSAFVGSGAAGQFQTWVKNNDLPDPADFLDGKVPFVHSPARLDRTAAVLTSATSLVVTNAKNAQLGSPSTQLNAMRAEKLWSFHKDLANVAPDLSLGSVVSLCTARMMIGSTTAYQVLGIMEPVMTAAGITPEQKP